MKNLLILSYLILNFPFSLFFSFSIFFFLLWFCLFVYVRCTVLYFFFFFSFCFAHTFSVLLSFFVRTVFVSVSKCYVKTHSV